VRRRRWIWVTPVVLLIACGAGYDQLQLRGSDRGFRHVTSRDLPSNVTAIAHSREMNDNLFHPTHYWQLQGPTDDLRKLAATFRLERSDEDAARLLEEILTVVPLGESLRLREGYEGSPDDGRDRWLVIVEPGDRAVFVY
jgi:hypothetical protein